MKCLIVAALTVTLLGCGKSLGVPDYTVLSLHTYPASTSKVGTYVAYALGGQPVETHAGAACMAEAVVGRLLPLSCR